MVKVIIKGHRGVKRQNKFMTWKQMIVSFVQEQLLYKADWRVIPQAPSYAWQ